MIHRHKVMVIYNTNPALSALSEQVADYYISARRLDPAHKYGVDMGGSVANSPWNEEQCYTDFISPLADYIEANNIECVLFSAHTPVNQTIAGYSPAEIRSLYALAGYAPWCKLLGHIPRIDSFKFNHNSASGSPAGTSPVSCTISQASPAVVTYTSGFINVFDPVVFSTDGTLPAPLVANRQYAAVNVNLGNKTFQVADAIGGTPINTTSAGSGNHTVKVDAGGGQLDVLLASETYGSSRNKKYTPNLYDWHGNPYWRPFGKIGHVFASGYSESYDRIKRIIDDAVYLESVGRPLAPIHFHQYDRTLPDITGLQVERARLETEAKGHPVRHSTADSTYSASWPIQPPANSYGSWINGELSANPQFCGGIVSPRIANEPLGSPWIDSFVPDRGSFLIDPTSSPGSPTLDFLFAGGCCGHGTTGEPFADNQPNTHTMMRLLLSGMTYVEAHLLSTPTGCYKEYVMGDPLLAPFSKQSRKAFAHQVWQ